MVPTVDRPLVSILMATHNTGTFVGEAIESVIGQTYQNWELIVFDDHSTDASYHVAHWMELRDPRVHAYRSHVRPGMGETMNAASDVASGEWIGQLDSDDLLEADVLEECVRAAAEPGVLGVCSKCKELNKDGTLTERMASSGEIINFRTIAQSFSAFHFRMVHESVMDAVYGYDPDIPAAIDFDFALRADHEIAKRGGRWARANAYHVYRRGRCGSISEDRLTQLAECRKAIKRGIAMRGLQNKVDVDVDVRATFRLRTVED